MTVRCSEEELLIYAAAGFLKGVKQITTGMASPIPACAALLCREMTKGKTRISILASRHLHSFTDGGVEIFDQAAQGRLGAFFLSGGQIDGHGNVNLVGVGDYPRMRVRWSGSFGSAYLYYLVPRVILFRFEHSRRTMVEQVDFVSAPGRSSAAVYRPGGPYGLLTNLCSFSFNKGTGRFCLETVHRDHTVEEVLANTGFEFDIPEGVAQTPEPPANVLDLIRGPVATLIADPYPEFAEQVFGKRSN